MMQVREKYNLFLSKNWNWTKIIMEELTCSTNLCNYKVGYYNRLENSYYWESWAFSMFSPKEWEKIGSISIINQMKNLSKNLLQNIKDYTEKEQLNLKWIQALEVLKIFEDKLSIINEELEDVLKTRELKSLSKIEQRSLDLKLKELCFIN